MTVSELIGKLQKIEDPDNVCVVGYTYDFFGYEIDEYIVEDGFEHSTGECLPNCVKSDNDIGRNVKVIIL